MAIDIPFKLLEINVISAQDLPPVSKMLRTFAVAWINPGQKLSTRIDHHGHTNPIWNYKLVFRVEDRFLLSEAAAITIEIYNVAWLRDLPIGTAHLMINQVSPPMMHNSPAMRTVALHIRRPSGHLQGILNVGVNILDNGSPRMQPPSESIVYGNSHDALDYQSAQAEENGRKDPEKLEKNYSESEKQSSIDEKMMLYVEEFNRAGAEGSTLDSINFDENPSKQKVGPKAISSAGSMASAMKPLPSEVVANLKKGFYSAGNDYGSSIFDNWTEEAGGNGLRSRSESWSFDDKTPLSKDHESTKKDRSRRRRNSEGGLFSCFGKDFEFTLICGSSNMKKNRKQMHRPQKYQYAYPEDDLRRFYP